ncbi:hypothetical protein [Desulfovibrio inopinatus]|uniref:hypothetical protein n=1 Tax=Desulfovibrio inopinatus TaxID=102109 RepID=UPI00040F97FB|nr:hypothetical protein [Desulfovibrio inopinatus]
MDTTVIRYVCLRCGKKFGLAKTADGKTPNECPVCKAPESNFAMIEDEKSSRSC